MCISDFENKFNCLVFFFHHCIYCWEQMNTVAGLDPHFVATAGRSILYWSYQYKITSPLWWCSNSRSENSSSSRDPCVCMCVTTSLSTCHRRERWDGKWRVGTRDPTNNTNWCAISPIGCCTNQWKNLRESLSLSLKKPISSSFLFSYSFASLPSFFFKLFFILDYMI